MEPSVVAAWWGAICGSAALIWDAIKWWNSGPKIKVSTSANMQTVTPGIGLDSTLLVLVSVRNIGDRSTTITQLLGYTFANRWEKIRNKPSNQFIITTGSESPIPFKIESGGTWQGTALQNELEKFTDENSLLYLGVQHSVADKPVTVRVNLKEKNKS